MQDLMRMEYFDIFVVTQLRAADAVSLALSCTQGRHLSAVKQRQLRIAISTTDLDNMKWCWIHPPADQCEDWTIRNLLPNADHDEGVLARLVRRAENCGGSTFIEVRVQAVRLKLRPRPAVRLTLAL